MCLKNSSVKEITHPLKVVKIFLERLARLRVRRLVHNVRVLLVPAHSIVV